MIKVFGDERSGNCLKVKWALEYIGCPFEWHSVDIMRGESRTSEFLALNPAGQVPLVLLEDGLPLSQSNAILLYFLSDSSLIPTDKYHRAKMTEWMFWEQYSHEPYLAVRRFQKLYLSKRESEIDPRLMEKGRTALQQMHNRLEHHDWLVGEKVSAADLSLLPYTAMASDGGFDLSQYPAIERWIDRVCSALRIDRPEE